MGYFTMFQHIQKSRNDSTSDRTGTLLVQSARYEWSALTRSQFLLVDSSSLSSVLSQPALDGRKRFLKRITIFPRIIFTIQASSFGFLRQDNQWDYFSNSFLHFKSKNNTSDPCIRMYVLQLY